MKALLIPIVFFVPTPADSMHFYKSRFSVPLLLENPKFHQKKPFHFPQLQSSIQNSLKKPEYQRKVKFQQQCLPFCGIFCATSASQTVLQSAYVRQSFSQKDGVFCNVSSGYIPYIEFPSLFRSIN